MSHIVSRMGDSSGEQLFQVNLRGVIGLLSKHIYSSPRVFLRELLQNGSDAIEARRIAEGLDVADPTWGIRIVPSAGPRKPMRFIDTGVGLTADDVRRFLATVGSSSKRDELDLRRDGYLGQFGIGLLSCFMISDTITVLSRSARGTDAVEWIGQSDGTFTMRVLEGREAKKVAIGTEVILVPRPDDAEYTSQPAVVEGAREFGEFLNVPVRVDVARSTESINRRAYFAEPFSDPSEELLEYGTELLGVRPLDAIDLAVAGTSTIGTAFVLPRTPAPGVRSSDRAYLGGILVSDNSRQLVPDWAFFVRCVIRTDGLSPTASREQFVEDDALAETRDGIGLAIRRWIAEIAVSDPVRLSDFIGIHEAALKALVLHDRDLARTVMPWLTLETSAGRMAINDLLALKMPIRFTESVDEFRQVVGVIGTDKLTVNAGYVNDAELVRALPRVFDGSEVERVRASDELDELALPPEEDAAAATALETRATAALASVGIDVLVRTFAPDDLPALYIADTELLRSLQRGTARDVATGLWGAVIGRIDDNVADRRAASGGGSLARLALNWSTQLVRTLEALDDVIVFDRSVRLIYVQALVAGQRVLTAADRALLTQSLEDLIHLSVSQTLDPRDA